MSVPFAVVVQRWWAAVSGGHFYSSYSAVVGFLLAVTILGPYAGIDGPEDALGAAAAAALAWLVLVAALVPVALLERRLVSPPGRAVLVLGALAVASVLRPGLNDLALALLQVAPSAEDWTRRILVNLLTWFIVLSMVAVATEMTVAAGAVNERLRRALAAMVGGSPEEADATAEARAHVTMTVDGLRSQLHVLMRGVVDFDTVRRFSEVVRSASHDLDALAEDPDALTVADGRRRLVWPGLRPPVPGMVGIALTIGCLPYAFSKLPVLPVVLLALTVIVLSLCVDELVQAASRRLPTPATAALVLGAAFLLGLGVSVAFRPLFDDPSPVWLVPVAVFPLLALLTGAAEGAAYRAEVQQRALTDALTVARRAPGRPGEILHASAGVLHGEVQGRCVVFAAGIEDAPATPAQTDDFVAAVERALDHAESPQLAIDDVASLRAMIDAWSPVMQLDYRAAPSADALLTDPHVAQTASEIVSEGLVNAVKHSASKKAVVSVGATSDGFLTVEVAAPGRLVSRRSRTGRGMDHLGTDARLFQRGGDVVLAATILAAPAA